jgi:hypothetical protein
MFRLCLIKHGAARHIKIYKDVEFHAFLNSEMNRGLRVGTKHQRQGYVGLSRDCNS